MSKRLQPEDAAARCARLFQREHASWLAPGGDGAAWPLVLPLGAPTERDAAVEPEAIRAWVQAWAGWPGPGQVSWQTRQWPRLGEQRLPAALRLASAEEVADLAGQGSRWRRAAARHRALVEACDALREAPTRQRVFDALADYADDDVERLLALLRWAAAHPASGLGLRQLPVEGLDTKWVEQRKGLIADLVSALRPAPDGEPAGRDLIALLGLAQPPARLRIRLLCPALRRQVGGLGDIEAPIAQLAALPIAPRLALVVENLDSGLALPELPGAVAPMKLGHAVGLLDQLPWLAPARVVYWGDIDTHGFVMLDRARRALPQVESLLMDRDTLLAHRALWGEEPQPHPGGDLVRLNAAERQVFDGLAGDVWGPRVRLEQERLPWARVLAALQPLAG
ncbi:MAG: hypothetical protein JNL87_01790 [Burkholderiaceae bacterium]|nr:hypothetical protein [Burkholderiaceae bacterium]